jgi:hypothetical protein
MKNIQFMCVCFYALDFFLQLFIAAGFGLLCVLCDTIIFWKKLSIHYRMRKLC